MAKDRPHGLDLLPSPGASGIPQNPRRYWRPHPPPRPLLAALSHAPAAGFLVEL